MVWSPAKGNCYNLSIRLVVAILDKSTKVTCLAPRDSASSPKAPVPANKSRHLAPTTGPESQLNSVSRTLSWVGRRPMTVANGIFLPRHSPPIIRKLWRPAWPIATTLRGRREEGESLDATASEDLRIHKHRLGNHNYIVRKHRMLILPLAVMARCQ